MLESATIETVYWLALGVGLGLLLLSVVPVLFAAGGLIGIEGSGFGRTGARHRPSPPPGPPIHTSSVE